MSGRNYYSSPPSPDAVSPVLNALRQAISSRRAAIQYKNYPAEEAADSSIVDYLDTLSRDTLYPPSFPSVDRKRTAKFFAKLSSKYPRLPRKDKDSTLQNLEERVGRNDNTKAALAGLATLAATGLIVGGIGMVAADDDDRFYGDFPGVQSGVGGEPGGDSTALLRDDDSSSAGGDDWGLDPSGRVNGMGSNMDADADGGGGFLEACFECFSGICDS